MVTPRSFQFSKPVGFTVSVQHVLSLPLPKNKKKKKNLFFFFFLFSFWNLDGQITCNTGSLAAVENRSLLGGSQIVIVFTLAAVQALDHWDLIARRG